MSSSNDTSWSVFHGKPYILKITMISGFTTWPRCSQHSKMQSKGHNSAKLSLCLFSTLAALVHFEMTRLCSYMTSLYVHSSPSKPSGWKLSIFRAFLTGFPSAREYSDLPKYSSIFQSICQTILEIFGSRCHCLYTTMWKYFKVFAKIFQSIWKYSKIFRPAASLDAAVLYIRVKSHGHLQPLLLVVEILNKAVQPKVERSITPGMVALPCLVHFEAPPAHPLLLLDGHLPHQDLLPALHEADQLARQLQPLNLTVLIDETLEHNFLEMQ